MLEGLMAYLINVMAHLTVLFLAILPKCHRDRNHSEFEDAPKALLRREIPN